VFQAQARAAQEIQEKRDQEEQAARERAVKISALKEQVSELRRVRATQQQDTGNTIPQIDNLAKFVAKNSPAVKTPPMAKRNLDGWVEVNEVEDEEVLLTGIEEAHSADDVELDHVNPFMRGAPLIVVGAIAFGAVLAAKYCSRRA